EPVEAGDPAPAARSAARPDSRSGHRSKSDVEWQPTNGGTTDRRGRGAARARCLERPPEPAAEPATSAAFLSSLGHQPGDLIQFVSIEPLGGAIEQGCHGL